MAAVRPSRPRRYRARSSRRPGRSGSNWGLVIVLLGVGAAYFAGDTSALSWVRGGAGGPLTGQQGDLRGSVTHVRDGDSVEVEDVAVRVANLDCAERDTAEGQAASARMRELVAGQVVVCDLEGRRSYDREVGTCALASSGQDLGEMLIAEGVCERWRWSRQS